MRTTLAFAAAVVAFAVPPWSWGQTCPEAGGHWPYGLTYASAFSAGRAYVGNGSALQVLDVADPSSPVVLGEVALPDAPQAMDVAGSLVYVADRWGGLRIVDASDPAAPLEVGGLKLPLPATDVEVAGSHAFLAGGSFCVVDISNPSHPTLVSSLQNSGLRLDVAGDHAYLADFDSFRVVDVANPTAPVEVASLPTESAQDVQVAGNLAYVADASWGWGGLRVVDVADPSAPVQVGLALLVNGAPSTVSLVAGYAYVTVGGGTQESLRVLSLANPTMPVELGTVVLDSLVEPSSFSTSSGLGGLADARDLRILDVSQPSPPFQSGLLDTSEPGNDVAVAGDLAFVADCAGVRVVDVSDLSAPAELGLVPVSNCAMAIAATGSLAFALDTGNDFLLVVNASVPGSPTQIGGLGIPGAMEIAAGATHVYVAAGDHGLRVVDVSDPATPAEVTSVTTVGRAVDVALQGSLLVLAIPEGVRLVDVADPTAPVALGWCSVPGTVRRVAVSGGYAVLTTATGALKVVDISNAATPTLVGSTDVSAGAVALEGEVAYVSTNDYWFPGGMGLGLVDLSDPTEPTLRAFGRSSLDGQGIAVSAGRVLLAGAASSTTGGLATFDATLGFGPVQVGSHLPGPSLSHVVTTGTHAYATADGDVMVFSMEGPGAPLPVGLLATMGSAVGVELVGDHLLVADWSALLVADLGQPQAPVIVGSVAMPVSRVAADAPLALAAVSGEVSVVDLTDPASPALRGSLTLSSTAADLALDGTLGAAVSSGLRILDLSDPDLPREVGVYPGWYQSVALSGSHAYLGSTTDLRVLDLSDPASPVEVAVLPIPALRLAVSGSLVVVSDRGLTTLLDVSEPRSPVPIGSILIGSDQTPYISGDLVALAGDAGLWRLDLAGCAGAVFADGFDSIGSALWSLTVP